MTVRLSPLLLPLNYTGGAQVTLAGAVAAADEGVVCTQTATALANLGPLLLPIIARTITPIVGNVSIAIVGAQTKAQAEELEGADATIYIDGKAALAIAVAAVIEASEALVIAFAFEDDGILFKVEGQRIEFHFESTRIQIKSEDTRISISVDSVKTGLN